MSSRSLTLDVTKAKNVQNDLTTIQQDKKVSKKEKRQYTEEEDSIILKRVKEMGYENPQTWKTLSKELDRSNPLNIKRRYDLITSRESKEMKRYTDEDDKFLCEYVQKNGNNQNTFSELAKLFGVTKGNIQSRHNLLTDENTWNRGPFTKKEDKQILKNVNVFGNNTETFKKLAVNLNRPYHTVIKIRYEWLMNKPSKPQSFWTLEEDKHLIEVLFKVNKKLHFKLFICNSNCICCFLLLFL